MTGGSSPRRAFGPVVGTSAGTLGAAVAFCTGAADVADRFPTEAASLTLDVAGFTRTATEAVHAASIAIAKVARSRTAAMLVATEK
jgi:hypothetical protein